VKERPILFSAPMVRALLAGTKTQTRRVCKPAEAHGLSFVVEVPDPQERGQVYNCSHFGDEEGSVLFASPYGGVGDRLWVREAWRTLNVHDHVPPRELSGAKVWYEAQDDVPFHPTAFGKLRPSMFMPRWASRLTLEVTKVYVERLQDISDADARAEGIEKQSDGIGWKRGPISGDIPNTATRTAFPRLAYQSLWESINGPGSWAANPWVWCVSFRRIEQ